MNKKEFINELSKELNYEIEKCIIINDILENNFFISKKNKDIIIKQIIDKLEVSIEEANKIYNISINIVKEEVKNKLKHPFKSKK